MQGANTKSSKNRNNNTDRAHNTETFYIHQLPLRSNACVAILNRCSHLSCFHCSSLLYSCFHLSPHLAARCLVACLPIVHLAAWQVCVQIPWSFLRTCTKNTKPCNTPEIFTSYIASGQCMKRLIPAHPGTTTRGLVLVNLIFHTKMPRSAFPIVTRWVSSHMNRTDGMSAV